MSSISGRSLFWQGYGSLVPALPASSAPLAFQTVPTKSKPRLHVREQPEPTATTSGLPIEGTVMDAG